MLILLNRFFSQSILSYMTLSTVLRPAQKGALMLILFCLLAASIAQGQNANQYSFAASSGTYTSILGQTGVGTIPTIHGDDMISTGIVPFQFSFNYCGNSYVGFKVCSNGWVSFESNAASTTSNNFITELNNIKPGLMPLWDNLTGASNVGATGLFMTTGTAPNRVFTYECNNWAWTNIAVSANISFQIKLYEGSDVIQFIYRPEAGSLAGNLGATIGICDGNVTPTYITLNNATASPTASSTNFYSSIATRPANGQIYQFTPPPPCSGTPPAALISPSGPISICLGSSVTLSGVLSPAATGVSYQWESSTTGSAPWTAVTGATTALATLTPSTATVYYRLVTTCIASSQQAFSAAVVVNTAPPTYALVPYFHDFETWGNYCDVSDIPLGSTTNWRGTPATGNLAWRRDDQGSTAGWSYPWGSYFPASKSGLRSARFSSGSASNSNPSTISTGSLDLFLDCSAQTGDKQAYFYFINQAFSWFSNDSLIASVSTNGGTSFNRVAVFDSADNWERASFPIASNSNQTVVRFTGYVSANGDFSDIGIDSLYIAPPCIGAPSAGILTTSGNACVGKSFNLQALGTTLAGNLSYSWQSSLNGTLWTTITGATLGNFTTPPLYDTIQYRMIVTCLGSNISDTSNPLVFNVSSPIYATVPYAQSFETWMSNCDTVDIPSLNWVNNPSTGDNSWRREDQGGTAWGFVFGDYQPSSKHLNHSARFHSSVSGGTGNLELFMNCSSPGIKELQFYYINPTSNFDSLRVSVSTNNGASFTSLASYAAQATWGLQQIPITSNSAQTIIRFQGVGDAQFMDDLGIDLVQVLPPCSGKPTAGQIDSFKVCSGVNFDLALTGTSNSGGLTYQWQSSPDNITWTNVTNGNTAIVTTAITAPTYFRAIVTCSHSGLADTSTSEYFVIAPFYLCYCNNGAQISTGEDIGNVTITRTSPIQIVLNNGNASPLNSNINANKSYTDYTNVTPAALFKGSTYNFKITAITDDIGLFSSTASVYIDLNQDGIFDPNTERVVNGNINTISHIFGSTYTIPNTALIGVTGMRVICDAGFGITSPCLQPYMGEVEDYLVKIDYPICTGNVNAGVATISDTLLCAHEPFSIMDTSYNKQTSGIVRKWQASTDNITWIDIPSSTDLDTMLLTAPLQSTYYRLKVTCTATNTNSYSTTVLLKIRPAYFCYCPSYADGGAADLSDVGAFSIGTYVINGGGPHLSNPGAIQSYTGNGNGVTLYRDSSYQVSLYHIIKDANQQDAKVTLFIDYNNNFVYDIPSERVWTGYTDINNVFINTTIYVPSTAVKNVSTGMRLILNNDVAPNTPSDEGCGTYTSGETEDFNLIIRDKNDPTSIPEVTNDISMNLYPNPTNGRVLVQINKKQVTSELHLVITNLVGVKIYDSKLTASTSFKEIEKEIDLSNVPSGVYFVELNSASEKIVKKLIVQ